MQERCHACGRRELRLSRLRDGDLSTLFRLRYPVRCRWCEQRDAVSIFKLPAILYSVRKFSESNEQDESGT
jgi:hypothetical protein